MLSSFRRSFAVLALAAFVVGCGADSSVAPVGQTTNLNQVFDELSFSDLGLTAAFAGLTDAVPAFPTIVPASCPYAAASQSFACPARTIGGVTVTQSYALLNGAGASQSAFDAATTAAVRMSSTMAGTLSIDGSNATLDGTQTLTLSGLLTGTHVLDGTSTTHVTGLSDGTGAQPVNLTVGTTIDKLVLPKNPSTASAPSWPASGTITVSTNTVWTGFPDSSFAVQLTFNGTSKVLVVFTMDGVSDHCTLDLASTNPSCS